MRLKKKTRTAYDEAISTINIALGTYRDQLLDVEDSTLLLEDYIEALSHIKSYLESEIKKSREQIKKNHKIAHNIGELISE